MNHREERLPHGQSVLVAGGVGLHMKDCLNSCELYTPSNGKWRPTGSMQKARVLHQMVQLQTGKVLVAGGKVFKDASKGKAINGLQEVLPECSCELYDPVLEIWMPTGDMMFGRADFQMLSLPDGRVLAAGGILPSNESVACELFDPWTRSWTLTGAMSTHRPGFRMVLLQDGSVLAVGGDGSGDNTELYDPWDEEWTATGPAAKRDLTCFEMVVLPNGCVLACGGQDFITDDSPPSDNELAENAMLGKPMTLPKLVASAMLYDPRTTTWARTDAPALARTSFQMVLLPDSKVMLAGGLAGVMWSGEDAGPTNWVEIYSCGEWSFGAPLTAAREGFSMLRLSDGAVMAAGGLSKEADDNGHALGGRSKPTNLAVSTAELLDTSSQEDEWIATGSMSTGRAHFQMVQL